MFLKNIVSIDIHTTYILSVSCELFVVHNNLLYLIVFTSIFYTVITNEIPDSIFEDKSTIFRIMKGLVSELKIQKSPNVFALQTLIYVKSNMLLSFSSNILNNNLDSPGGDIQKTQTEVLRNKK